MDLPDKNIRFIKLSSGEEIISEINLDEQNRGILILINPFRVYNLYADGHLFPQFHPMVFGVYFLTARLNANDVMMALEPGEAMTSFYYQFLEQLKADSIRPPGTTLH
jgi:hypothetical protein